MVIQVGYNPCLKSQYIYIYIYACRKQMKNKYINIYAYVYILKHIQAYERDKHIYIVYTLHIHSNKNTQQLQCA